MSYTPGPWKVSVQHGSNGLTWWQVDAGRTLVHLTSEADARLIAASPRMAEALESLAGDVYLFAIAEITQDQLLRTQGEALAVLREAGLHAKATGEQP